MLTARFIVAGVFDGLAQLDDGSVDLVITSPPFLGSAGLSAGRVSGTTLAVATGHGLDAIGIDIDERNAELTTERVGPFLMEQV